MIENIEKSPEFQRLLKDNPELSNLKDFFTYRIEKFLSEKLDDSINKDYIEKQDFDLFEKDLENIKEYDKILKENNINISDLELIEKLIMGQTLDEFREFFKDNEIWIFFSDLNTSNFIKITYLYNITTAKGLQKLLKKGKLLNLITYGREKNFGKLFELKDFSKVILEEILQNKEIVNIIEQGKEDNFNKVWKLYDIKTIKDLQELVKKENLIKLIIHGKERNFGKLFELKDFSKESLEILVEDSEIVNLIMYGNENNLNEVWELYDIKTIKDLQELVKKENLMNCITDGYERNFGKLFKLKDFSKENLEILVENPKIVNLIQNGNENNLNEVWKLYDIKIIKDLQDLVKNENLINLIIHGKGNNFGKLFELKDFSKENLEILVENPKATNLIENGKENNFNKIWESYNIKTVENLQKLVKDEELVSIIIYYSGYDILKIIEFSENNYSLKNICDTEIIKHNLFTVRSMGSVILKQLFTKLEKDKDTGMYNIMKNDINDYLKQQNLPKKSNEIKEEEKLDISIYLRYGHTVNYPEIGEYIILFVDKYLQNGYSKYIKNIRIIPRNYRGHKCTPREGLFKNIKKGKLYNAIGKNDFEKVLKEGSVPFYLSHSVHKDDGEREPYIISNSMSLFIKNHVIKSNFDLESNYDMNKTHKMTLEDIFSELIRILEEVDNKIDLSIK